MTDFLLKSTLCLGLLFAVYFFLLEKEKMHHFNRFYLLFSLVFSMVIPFISFEIYVETIEVIQQNTIQAFPVSSVIIEEETNYLPLILWSIYVLITTILVLRFSINLIKIQRKINSNIKEVYQNSTLVLLDEKVLPHTFLNYILINKDDYENRKIEDELFTHELTHVRQKHTLDILFIEILKTIFWFNPILMFYKKAIQLNHEFLADEKVVKSYNNVPFYQNLLLEKASWNNTFYLASNLNFLVTKKRLIMMTKSTSAKIMLLKKVALLPLFTGLMYFICVETVAQQKIETINQESKISDKTKDAYFAGVRIKVYKNASKTKTGTIRDEIILDKLYEELTPEEKEKYKMWLHIPKPFQKKSPTKKELDDYKNSVKFAIWIDGKNVPNSDLNKYKHEDIAYFSGSSVLKNARTKKHPQPFQFWFYTHSYFDKNEMGKQQEKYESDLIEIFENYNDRKGNKQTVVNLKKSDVYSNVEKKPTFQGGLEKFYEFIGQNFKVPDVKNLEGKLITEFIVETDGSLSEIKVLKDIGHGTAEEAIRVLKSSPKWNPGEQDGKPVRVMYSLPISITTGK
ncbi:M56 family metallopeptidase [Flavobacterium soli]|uniref:M56 family metallopeptidase n=1 Tax=Flavobacterium soli TaxID=344881 RepID=UPI0003FBF8A5|nr:M56 family metallopeptidase [Flavobacterium soli]